MTRSGVGVWLMEDARGLNCAAVAGAWAELCGVAGEAEVRRVAWGEVGNRRPDVVLLALEDWGRLREQLLWAKGEWKQTPVVGILPEWALGGKELANAMAEGLDDFLVMPLRRHDFEARLRVYGAWQPGVKAGIEGWKKSHRLESLVGECPEFVKALEKIPAFAAAEATVLILGETGSGKELFARGVHYCSGRQKGPFVPVNCGALPEQLFENELFGHARGAYTDARTNVEGLLAVAARGTLFLDEVDGLALSSQVKLLRLLQNREYRPLGSTKTQTADVRIVAAMNGNPERLLAEGKLREDLYHRLNVLRIVVPPLRRRGGDIGALAEHYLVQFSRHYRRRLPRMTAAAREVLERYEWPGNIRELEAVMQRAVLLCGAVIDAGDLELTVAAGGDGEYDQPLRSGKERMVAAFERTYLMQLLERFQGNVSKAAGAAGKDRRTFQRLIRKYGLEVGVYRNPGLASG